MYVEEFQATGCPNPNPMSITWWKTQTDVKVFEDMMLYCTLVRDGNASPRQIKECCGLDSCVPSSCIEQQGWGTGNTLIFLYHL